LDCVGLHCCFPAAATLICSRSFVPQGIIFLSCYRRIGRIISGASSSASICSCVASLVLLLLLFPCNSSPHSASSFANAASATAAAFALFLFCLRSLLSFRFFLRFSFLVVGASDGNSDGASLGEKNRSLSSSSICAPVTSTASVLVMVDPGVSRGVGGLVLTGLLDVGLLVSGMLLMVVGGLVVPLMGPVGEALTLGAAEGARTGATGGTGNDLELLDDLLDLTDFCDLADVPDFCDLANVPDFCDLADLPDLVVYAALLCHGDMAGTDAGDGDQRPKYLMKFSKLLPSSLRCCCCCW